MKILVTLCCCFLIFACDESTTEKTEVLQAKEVTSKSEQTQEISKKDFSDKLPIINFQEFEIQYLQSQDNEQTYVINFWATWCKPCVKELPYFEEIKTNYEKQNVAVVLVSLDFPENIEKQVLPFIEKHQLKSKIVLLDDPDANNWIPKVDKTWSGAIPATIIVKGDQYKFYEQSFTYSELETELKSIL